jgi:hypothetical protein
MNESVVEETPDRSVMTFFIKIFIGNEIESAELETVTYSIFLL